MELGAAEVGTGARYGQSDSDPPVTVPVKPPVFRLFALVAPVDSFFLA